MQVSLNPTPCFSCTLILGLVLILFYLIWSRSGGPIIIERIVKVEINSTYMLQFVDGKEMVDDSPPKITVYDTLADALYDKVRVLCLITTNHWDQARQMNKTWPKHCNKAIFHKVTMDTNQNDITSLLQQTFNDYVNEFDWLIKTNSNSFVIVENLRRFLSDKDFTSPGFYGHQRTTSSPEQYVDGSSLVINKPALRRLALVDGACDPYNDRPEDVMISQCLLRLGVKLRTSKDSDGGSIFNSSRHDARGGRFDITDVFRGRHGMDQSPSHYPITFPNVTLSEMYLLYYFTYKFRVYGSGSTFLEFDQLRNIKLVNVEDQNQHKKE